jgi:hypothetical protein
MALLFSHGIVTCCALSAWSPPYPPTPGQGGRSPGSCSGGQGSSTCAAGGRAPRQIREALAGPGPCGSNSRRSTKSSRRSRSSQGEAARSSKGSSSNAQEAMAASVAAAITAAGAAAGNDTQQGAAGVAGIVACGYAVTHIRALNAIPQLQRGEPLAPPLAMLIACTPLLPCFVPLHLSQTEYPSILSSASLLAPAAGGVHGARQGGCSEERGVVEEVHGGEG